MAGKKWSTQEIDFLINSYGSFGKIDLLKGLPNRSWDSIKLKARHLNLCFYQGVHEHVKGDLSSLLKDNPVSYYWNGFLAADGSFVGNR